MVWQVGKLLFAKTVPLPPGLEDMIRQRIGAIQSGAADVYRMTTHPASLAHHTDENREFFEEATQKDFARKIPADYKLGAIPILENQPLLMDEYLDYPVRPTYMVKIDYKKAPNSFSTVYWNVSQDSGKWYVVLTPPDLSVPGMKQAIAQKQGLKVVDDKKIEELYYRTDTGFLAELRDLIYKNQRVEAINRCKSKLNLELTEAVQFVDLVAKP